MKEYKIHDSMASDIHRIESYLQTSLEIDGNFDVSRRDRFQTELDNIQYLIGRIRNQTTDGQTLRQLKQCVSGYYHILESGCQYCV